MSRKSRERRRDRKKAAMTRVGIPTPPPVDPTTITLTFEDLVAEIGDLRERVSSVQQEVQRIGEAFDDVLFELGMAEYSNHGDDEDEHGDESDEEETGKGPQN